MYTWRSQKATSLLLHVRQRNDRRFVVNVTKESLEKMPGFDKDHWPDLNDLEYAQGVYRQWGATPYWT